MGAIAMVGAVFCYWRFVSRQAALILIAFLVVGVFTYWKGGNDDTRLCDNKAWFCSLLPKGCLEPISTRIFVEDRANAEVQRLTGTGLCQEVAIKRVARGWQAEYSPEYSWWQRLLR